VDERLAGLASVRDVTRGWREALHPRDRKGEFAGKGGGGRPPQAAGVEQHVAHYSGHDDKALLAAISDLERQPAGPERDARLAAARRVRQARIEKYRAANRLPLGAGPVTGSGAVTDYTRRAAVLLARVGPKGYSHGWVRGPAAEHPDVAMHVAASYEALNRGDHETAVNHLKAALDKVRDPETARQIRALHEHLTGGARRALTHEPIGKPGGGVWGMKGKQYPAYFQHIRNDLMESGHPEAQAHSLAWGILRNFAAGHDGKGNRVSADTQAKAAAALAEMKKLQAEAKASRSAPMSSSTEPVLDPTWDGSLDDLPDLTGLTLADLDAAAADDPDFADWAAPEEASRLAKLGSGARFAALKAKLSAKGIDDPGALAAKIGRKKFGKARFGALAAAARKKAAPAAASRAGGVWGELFRYWPLEECRIMRAAEGREYASGRVVEAYAAVYGQRAEIRDHQGHYEEEINRAAFDDTLRVIHPQANGGYWRATCLYNHGMTVHGTPAERFSLPAGLPLHIGSEGKGLLTRTEYAPTPLGDELLALVEMGALRSQSFTGGIIRSNPMLRGPGDRYRRVAGGALPVVERLALGLREYGLTPFAAYSGAEVLGVRMQLPGGLHTEAGWGDTEDGAAPAGYGDGPGDPPEDGDASRSTGNRLYRLRTQEALERAGITLPDRD
jgi:phage head maturation protease